MASEIRAALKGLGNTVNRIVKTNLNHTNIVDPNSLEGRAASGLAVAEQFAINPSPNPTAMSSSNEPAGRMPKSYRNHGEGSPAATTLKIQIEGAKRSSVSYRNHEKRKEKQARLARLREEFPPSSAVYLAPKPASVTSEQPASEPAAAPSPKPHCAKFWDFLASIKALFAKLF